MWWLSLMVCALIITSTDASAAALRDYGRIILLPTLANGSGSVGAKQVAACGHGSAYVAGNFSGPGSYSFGNTNFHFASITGTGNGMFVAKYDGNGDCVWVRRISAGWLGGIAAHGSRVLLAAKVEEPDREDQKLRTSPRQYSGIIAQIDESGIFVWTRQTGGGHPTRICVIPDGSFVVVGELKRPTRFGNTELKNTSYCDLFLAKYSPEGNLIWAKEGGKPAYARGVAVDSIGNIYVTGSILEAARFGHVTLPVANQGDVFLAKYDGSGNLIWVRSSGGDAWLSGHNVAVDAADNPHLTGLLNVGKRTFGTVPISNESPFNNNVFYAKYTAGGEFEFVRQFRKGDFDFQNIVVIPLHLLGRPLEVKSSDLTSFNTKGGNGMVTRLLETSQEASALGGLSQTNAVPARLTWWIEGSELVLAWPVSLSGFVLESSAMISPQASWSAVSSATQTSKDLKIVRIDLKKAQPFYRLAKPQSTP